MNIKVKFYYDRAAQRIVDCDRALNGNSFAFWNNVQKQLMVFIHGVHPSISDAVLEQKLMPYFVDILDIKRNTK